MPRFGWRARCWLSTAGTSNCLPVLRKRAKRVSRHDARETDRLVRMWFEGKHNAVRLLRVRVTPVLLPHPTDPLPGITITAQVEVEATVAPVRATPSQCCEGCFARMPEFDATDTDMLYEVLAYHDGERLLFPAAENEPLERDQYRVPGWRRTDRRILCPECNQAVADALLKRRHAAIC